MEPALHYKHKLLLTLQFKKGFEGNYRLPASMLGF